MDTFAEGNERAVIDRRRAGELVDAMLDRIRAHAPGADHPA
ncbi:MAG: hypothetical protein QM820_40150 [Minicystis sp.]